MTEKKIERHCPVGYHSCEEVKVLELQVNDMRPVVEAALALSQFLPASDEFKKEEVRLCAAINAYNARQSEKRDNLPYYGPEATILQLREHRDSLLARLKASELQIQAWRAVVDAAIAWRKDAHPDLEGALAVAVDTITGGPLSKKRVEPSVNLPDCDGCREARRLCAKHSGM